MTRPKYPSSINWQQPTDRSATRTSLNHTPDSVIYLSFKYCTIIHISGSIQPRERERARARTSSLFISLPLRRPCPRPLYIYSRALDPIDPFGTTVVLLPSFPLVRILNPSQGSISISLFLKRLGFASSPSRELFSPGACTQAALLVSYSIFYFSLAFSSFVLFYAIVVNHGASFADFNFTVRL